MEINFYQTDDVIYKSIAPLLLKMLEEEKKALIYCQSNLQMAEIDSGLWNFSKTKFLPHATKAEKLDPIEQPVFITDESLNANQGQYLLKFGEVNEDFLKQFERVFYFFGAENTTEARALWKKYKQNSFSLNFYKKEGGAWTKVDL
ncbi:MAG: polymerase subunit chi [Rickettsiaceae bacterium]|jgi:DNA polymerase IIIc chi subunit|nr:polymerase subunit chi [Rickettsiaceae bacterium]